MPHGVLGRREGSGVDSAWTLTAASGVSSTFMGCVLRDRIVGWVEPVCETQRLRICRGCWVRLQEGRPDATYRLPREVRYQRQGVYAITKRPLSRKEIKALGLRG